MSATWTYCSSNCKWLFDSEKKCLKYKQKIDYHHKGFIRCKECDAKIGYKNEQTDEN